MAAIPSEILRCATLSPEGQVPKWSDGLLTRRASSWVGRVYINSRRREKRMPLGVSPRWPQRRRRSRRSESRGKREPRFESLPGRPRREAFEATRKLATARQVPEGAPLPSTASWPRKGLSSPMRCTARTAAATSSGASTSRAARSFLVGNEWGMPVQLGPAKEKEKRPESLSRNVLCWSRSPDLNWGPTDYESVALPTELLRLDRRERESSRDPRKWK